MLILAGLLDDVLRSRRYSASYFGGTELVDRIARNDLSSTLRRLGVEAGWTVCTSDNATRKIVVRQREHVAVLIERAAPGHNLVESKHR